MPSIETFGLIGLAVLAALGWFGSWWHSRKHIELFKEARRQRRIARERKQEIHRLEEVMDDADKNLKTFEIVERQRDGFRKIVTDVQAERDSWMNLYYSQATGHDNAQRWMMRETQTLAQQVMQLGGKPRVDPIVERVREEFKQEHGQHIADHKSGEAAGSHAEKVEKENARVAELDGIADPELPPQ